MQEVPADMKNPFRSISFKAIVSIVLILTLFAVIVCAIGYSGFRDAMFNQFSDDAFRVARAAARAVDADRIGAYMESGGEGEEYRAVWNRLDQLCNGTEATFIYVIVPDLEDYGHITFVFSTVLHGTQYSPYEVGYVRATTNMEYRQKYKALYAGESERELLRLEDRAYANSTHHITAMVPLRGSDGQTTAILCVQRQLTILSALQSSYVRSVLTVLLILTLLVIVGEGWLLGKTVIRPIRCVTEEASRFARENVIASEKLSSRIRNRDEIGVLAASIDQMEEQVVSYVDNLTKITAEQERIEAELDIARQIQHSMLPGVFPAFPERTDFEISALMDPAREVGGDFYDFFLTDDEHLALVIADVSGKGIPAALLMTKAMGLIKNQLLAGSSPAEALRRVNVQLCEGNEQNMFVTAWVAVLALSSGQGVSVNAGHEHPTLRRSGGLYELVCYRHSPVLGALPEADYRERRFVLQPGDSIFVYTDGVPEAADEQNRLFGSERMLDALNRDPEAVPEVLLQTVLESVEAFAGKAPQFDDITMLCLRYRGSDA